MIYLSEFYLLICVLALAGKDADSYLLKAKQDDSFSAGRVKRWHRDGFILYVLYALPLTAWLPVYWWKIPIAAILLRLSLFDLGFNKWSSLPLTYLGGTAWADRQFIRVFGINGAVKKSLAFFALLVGLNILNYFI